MVLCTRLKLFCLRAAEQTKDDTLKTNGAELLYELSDRLVFVNCSFILLVLFDFIIRV